MFGFKMKFNLVLLKIKWRKANKHNYTSPQSIFNFNNVTVGNRTYGDLHINIGTNSVRTISIGNFCSIAPNVNFLINPHNYKFFSTWGWQRFCYNEFNYDWENKTQIVVEDDVWIGQAATILGGVTLHQGCVIGTGSIVTKDVPPYAIYAKGEIIKYRFLPDVCDKLLKIDYSRIDDKVIKLLKGWHEIEITDRNVDQLLAILPLKRAET